MNEERPIIIKRAKGGHDAHHSGSWKVAYADFVTAMMAFFLVMWILGLSQDTRKSIAAYFNDPTGMMKSMGGGQSPMSVSQMTDKGRITVFVTSGKLGREKEFKKFADAKRDLEKAMDKSPELQSLKKYVEITITSEGLRIELLDGPEPVFFESGSSQCRPRALKLLGVIAQEIGKLPNDVAMEGHTDSQPYSGGKNGYSNWELSADRANGARRVMQSALGPHQVVEVRGYADRHLRRPEDPSHFSNRRVSILVKSGTNDAPPKSTAPGGPLGVDLTPKGAANARASDDKI